MFPIIMRLNYESFRHLYQKPPCIEILDKDEIKRFQQTSVGVKKNEVYAIDRS